MPHWFRQMMVLVLRWSGQTNQLCDVLHQIASDNCCQNINRFRSSDGVYAPLCCNQLESPLSLTLKLGQRLSGGNISCCNTCVTRVHCLCVTRVYRYWPAKPDTAYNMLLGVVGRVDEDWEFQHEGVCWSVFSFVAACHFSCKETVLSNNQPTSKVSIKLQFS